MASIYGCLVESYQKNYGVRNHRKNTAENLERRVGILVIAMQSNIQWTLIIMTDH